MNNLIYRMSVRIRVDSLTGHGSDVDFMNNQFLEGYSDSGDESASSEDWDYETSEEW